MFFNEPINKENGGNFHKIISDRQTDVREYGVAVLQMSFNEVENFRCMFKEEKGLFNKGDC